MKLRVFDAFEVEGSEVECAMYTCILLEAIRMKDERDKNKEVDEWMKKYGEKTFAELMEMERGDKE